MKIAVLAGGNSCEWAVSRASGERIAQALRRKGHTVTLIDPVLPYRKGQSRPDWSAAPDTERPFLWGEGVLDTLSSAERVFCALHGGAGEDGTVQSTLDSLGISYTGSGREGCTLAQNKALAKAILRQGGVPTPKGTTIEAGQTRLVRRVQIPCIYKPQQGGSSVGLYRFESRRALAEHLRQTPPDCAHLLEEYIEGQEYSVAVLAGCALPVVQIIPAHTCYDFACKYEVGGAQELCPAPLSCADTQRLQELALRAAKLLRQQGYCRVDFLRRQKDSVFLCLEANSAPGMTPTSLLPLCAQAQGMDFDTLCEAMLYAKEGGA